MQSDRIIVIGGGAAGLLAAGEAARQGASVLLLERQNRLGHKLSLTGKGRCNLTNSAPLVEFITHYGHNGQFLRQAFNRFFSTELVALMGELGIGVVEDHRQRVYPENNDAVAVSEALAGWVKAQHVTIQTNQRVEELVCSGDRVTGVRTDKGELSAGAVILATGGLSYPGTGATGDGYRLAAAVGHTIVPTRPALIPLITEGDLAHRLQGLSLSDAEISLVIDGRCTRTKPGEMIFTHFGLSGPDILTLSREAVDALIADRRIEISLDLAPSKSVEQLDHLLLELIKTHGKKQIDNLLKQLLPAKMIPVCCHLNGIDPGLPGNQLSHEQRSHLIRWLKDFRFVVTGHRPIEEATVTAGGIYLKEVDPRTMGSRIIRGLFFAGEILDIDGETGGFNLQAAFSTGWLAGHAAASD